MKGTAVLILDDQDRLLVLKRSESSHWMPGKWGLPGGKVESGETTEGAVARETLEETGLFIGDLVHILDHSNKMVDIFYARDYEGKVKLDFEHDDFEWVSREDIDYYDTTPDLLEKFDWVLENER